MKKARKIYYIIGDYIYIAKRRLKAVFLRKQQCMWCYKDIPIENMIYVKMYRDGVQYEEGLVCINCRHEYGRWRRDKAFECLKVS